MKGWREGGGATRIEIKVSSVDLGAGRELLRVRGAPLEVLSDTAVRLQTNIPSRPNKSTESTFTAEYPQDESLGVPRRDSLRPIAKEEKVLRGVPRSARPILCSPAGPINKIPSLLRSPILGEVSSNRSQQLKSPTGMRISPPFSVEVTPRPAVSRSNQPRPKEG